MSLSLVDGQIVVPGSWQHIAVNSHPWADVINAVESPLDKENFRNHAAPYIEDSTRYFRRLPRRFRFPVAKRFQSIFKKAEYGGAIDYLKASVERLPKGVYSITADDGELILYARRKAKEYGGYAAGLSDEEAYRVLGDRLEAIGLSAPEYGKQERTIGGAVARMCDEHWWRSLLRKTQGRHIEQAARDFGLVHKKAGIYSSDEALYRRKGQKRRNRLMLEECLAINELGDKYTLAELSDLSVSNPAIRRGELMTRIRGFEEVAVNRGDQCEFITITCPSRFHAYYASNSARNKKFDPDLTPRDAQQYLSKCWQRIRSSLDRKGIKLYGFRVAEPNHCGCPHWHVMAFVAEKQVQVVRDVVRRYALADSPDEAGADRYRVKFVSIDPAKGTAAGYIAKYISKNIDGHGLYEDLYGKDIDEAVERIDAWAACWGIRQFQQIGGPPVTVWRELRRLDSEEDGILEDVRRAADEGDWSAYVMGMGGPVVERKNLPVRAAYLQDIDVGFDDDPGTGELRLNKYGELASGRVVGLQADGVFILTRWHQWTVGRVGNEPLPIGECIDKADPEKWSFIKDFVRWGPIGFVPDQPLDAWLADRPLMVEKMRSASARPWTCVNNCTGDADGKENFGVEDVGWSPEKRAHDAKGQRSRAGHEPHGRDHRSSS